MGIKQIVLASAALLACANANAELYASYNAAGNCTANSVNSLGGTGGFVYNLGGSRLVFNCAMNVPYKIMRTRTISHVRLGVRDQSPSGKIKAWLCIKSTIPGSRVRCGPRATTSKRGKGNRTITLYPPAGNYRGNWIPFVSVNLPKVRDGMSGIWHMSLYIK